MRVPNNMPKGRCFFRKSASVLIKCDYIVLLAVVKEKMSVLVGSCLETLFPFKVKVFLSQRLIYQILQKIQKQREMKYTVQKCTNGILCSVERMSFKPVFIQENWSKL